MKSFQRKKLLFVILFSLIAQGNIMAQSYFNTVSNSHYGIEKDSIDTPSIYLWEEEDAEEVNVNTISLDSLQSLLDDYFHLRDSLYSLSLGKKGRIWRLYHKRGSLPLSYSNLIKVMKEVGISNHLYVLSQACLETGFFTSRVFQKYNNLFGLYDSKAKDYYRFERWEDSVAGYKKFIQYRYKGGDYLRFLRRIGYAEDPGYTAKVNKIAKTIMKYGHPHGHP